MKELACAQVRNIPEKKEGRKERKKENWFAKEANILISSFDIEKTFPRWILQLPASGYFLQCVHPQVPHESHGISWMPIHFLSTADGVHITNHDVGYIYNDFCHFKLTFLKM